jgi:transcription antitermination factor NusA-like protein
MTIEIQGMFLPSIDQMAKEGREEILKDIEEIKKSIDEPKKYLLLVQRFYSDTVGCMVGSMFERREEAEEFVGELLKCVEQDVKRRLRVIYEMGEGIR